MGTKKRNGQSIRTLAIDIGGQGIKALLLDEKGDALTERVRVETPRPATTDAVLAAVFDLVKPLAPYDRISMGFPGVVQKGVTKTAPNLHLSWNGFPLAEKHPSQMLSIPHVSLVAEERTLKGSYIGSAVPARDIPRYIALMKQGKLPVDRVVSDRIALDQVNTALDRLDHGDAVRQVICF
jgi:threonine dehydrogenase-like Zn-dependent dehydrogenase